MEKRIILKVQGLNLIGQLKYENGNKSEIFLTLSKNENQYFKKLWDNPESFNINGEFDDGIKFTAFYCYVVQSLYIPKNNSVADGLMAMIDFHSNAESDRLFKYRIEIGKLYLNAPDVNDEMIIKKVDIKFSSIDKWIPNDENKKIFIKQNDCNIKISNSFITIESLNIVTLKQLNNILFDLLVFFEVIVLSNSVKRIEKFIYTINETKIEEIMTYKQEARINEQFLFDYDTNTIEDILNHWFQSKNMYGKIFDYLSGILNESSAEYLELKFLMLIQWIEAYSREFLNHKIQAIINESISNSDEQKLLLSQSQNNNNFRKNLKDIIKIHDFKIILGINKDEQNRFIDQLICYRNHLTHINIKDDLHNGQMLNLYEVLKDMIYILLMQGLNVSIDNRIDDVKRKYLKYKNLETSIKKCQDQH